MFVPRCVCVCVCLVTLVLHHSLCVCDTFHWHSWASFTFGCPDTSHSTELGFQNDIGNVYYESISFKCVLHQFDFDQCGKNSYHIGSVFFFLNLYVVFWRPTSPTPPRWAKYMPYVSAFNILYLWLYLYFVFVTHMLCHAPAGGPRDAKQQSLARSENAPHCHIPRLRGSPTLPPVGIGSKKTYLGLTKTSRS